MNRKRRRPEELELDPTIWRHLPSDIVSVISAFIPINRLHRFFGLNRKIRLLISQQHSDRYLGGLLDRIEKRLRIDRRNDRQIIKYGRIQLTRWVDILGLNNKEQQIKREAAVYRLTLGINRVFNSRVRNEFLYQALVRLIWRETPHFFYIEQYDSLSATIVRQLDQPGMTRVELQIHWSSILIRFLVRRISHPDRGNYLLLLVPVSGTYLYDLMVRIYPQWGDPIFFLDEENEEELIPRNLRSLNRDDRIFYLRLDHLYLAFQYRSGIRIRLYNKELIKYFSKFNLTHNPILGLLEDQNDFRSGHPLPKKSSNLLTKPIPFE